MWARPADPWAGSYYVESLTDAIMRRAWEHIEEIEELGWMAKAIETGLPKMRIEEAGARRQANMDNRCFIRPSHTGGALGGVARKSRESMFLCEASGFDLILIETVGVGQSEITVRSMVDFFLLLMLAGAGDELQGIKKGIIELADAVIITKADGDNRSRAEVARSEYERAIHYVQPATEGWNAPVLTCSACSAVSGKGIKENWSIIERFRDQAVGSGLFDSRRKSQTLEWIHEIVDEHLCALFFNHPGVAAALPEIEKRVLNGSLPPTAAATRLISIFEGKGDKPEVPEI